MPIPVFHDETYTSVGAQTPVLLNRWAGSNYSIAVVVGTTGLYTLEGTLSRLDSDAPDPPVWLELSGLVDLTTSITDAIKSTPLSAIRMDIQAVDTAIRLLVRQGGQG